MKTVYYHVETKTITCRAGKEERASGAAEGVRCVVVPRRRCAGEKKPGGTVIRLADYRDQREKLQNPDQPEEAEQSGRKGRAAFGLLLDVCATAAIVAVCVLVAVRFWLL